MFSILISNTDDHLRYHGFLYEGQKGWRLSSVYNVNPTPVGVKERVLTTAISEDDGTASLGLALSVAREFGLKATEARQVAAEVGAAVATWRAAAEAANIGKAEIDRMASALVMTICGRRFHKRPLSLNRGRHDRRHFSVKSLVMIGCASTANRL